MLMQGSKGVDVKELQKKLGVTADGIFGPKTKLAVILFQQKNGLPPTGEVDQITQSAFHMTKIHKAEDVQLSEHFNEKEFACHGDNLIMLYPELIYRLELLRKEAGKPISVNSGYRSPQYNKKIGGAKNSQHMVGKAADIKIQGLTPSQVAKLAEKVGFRGIGTYDTFTHVDVRANKARWSGKGE